MSQLYPRRNPSKSSHAEQIIGVEKGEMSTADDPGAPVKGPTEDATE
jgi:hypothetical protein